MFLSLSTADIGSGSSCKPYSLQSCAHHVDPPEGMVACSSLPEYSTPKCKSACSEAAYGAKYADDKHKASSSYSIKTVANMQKELMEKVSIFIIISMDENYDVHCLGHLVRLHDSVRRLRGLFLRGVPAQDWQKPRRSCHQVDRLGRGCGHQHPILDLRKLVEQGTAAHYTESSCKSLLSLI